MWRCNHHHCLLLFSFGLGVLLGSVIESGFICALLIAAAVGLGLFAAVKTR